MSARERTVSILNSLICSHVGKTDMINDLLDNIIKEVKEECCSGELKWSSPALRPYQQEIIDELRASFAAPSKIQGYTAEEWQEIIDGGYLCEVRDSETEGWYEGLIQVVGLNEGGGVHGKQGHYEHCRPAQIKGVMRPIFVEPVDKDGKDRWCLFFDKDNHVINNDNSGIGGHYEWARWNKHLASKDATKYIEV